MYSGHDDEDEDDLPPPHHEGFCEDCGEIVYEPNSSLCAGCKEGN